MNTARGWRQRSAQERWSNARSLRSGVIVAAAAAIWIGVRCTDPKYAAVVDSGKRMELISNVSLVAGVAALGAGATMLIFGGPSVKPRPPTGAWVIPSVAVSPYGAQLRYEGAF